MKKVWLLYYEKYVDKNRYFIEQMIAKGCDAGLDIKLVTVENIKNKKQKPDAVISRVINPALTGYLEESGIKVFNKASVSALCNNKAETIRRMHKEDIIHIPTIAISLNENGKYIYERIESRKQDGYNDMLRVVSNTLLDNIFGDNADNHNSISDVDLSKYVIKSVTGHGGSEVMLLSEYCKNNVVLGVQEKDACEYYSDKYIIQPLMSDYISDLRIYAVGNEIIGAVKRTAASGFKANYSLGGNISLYYPDDYITDIVKKIFTIDDFSYIGIDFLFAGGKIPVFNEIEDVVGAKMLSACGKNGYVEKYIEYISRNIL